ncbi:MAG: hypothetical protein P4L83_08260 [Nevskia sp.]|nr:hypothetical protein [Nevskia sp.]
MLDNKFFWYPQQLFLVGFWLASAWLLLHGQTKHWLVGLATVMLITHALEIPLVLRLLKGRDPAPAHVSLMTLIFGLTWWVPARRGVFAVR